MTDKTFTAWMAVQEDAWNLLLTFIDQPDEDIPPQYLRSVQIFRSIADLTVIDQFKRPQIAQEIWVLTTIHQPAPADALRDDIEYLLAEWPNQVGVMGAWNYDGRIAGTSWVEDQDGNRIGTEGDPPYPVDETQLLKFMPDVEVQPPTDPPTFEPATELTDVNLRQGQSPRIWQVGPFGGSGGVVFIAMTAGQSSNGNRIGYRRNGFGDYSGSANVVRIDWRPSNDRVRLVVDGDNLQDAFNTITINGVTLASADATFTVQNGRTRWSWTADLDLTVGDVYPIGAT